MKKGNLLAIGCGGCGNNLLDEFLGLDKRYTGIFMNTNILEMENLKHFDRDRRCFYIPNADGTGKNRKLAEKYIKEEGAKFAEVIKKFENQDTILFLSSGNGGTGSKAVTLYPPLIKKLCPEKTILLVATFPNISEADIDFENAKEFWNEVIELKNKGAINNVQFIDNNSAKNESQINIAAMKDLDASFDMVNGKLDASDLYRYHKSKNYKVFLKLDSNIRDTETAIDKAISDSVYFIPDAIDPNVLECDVLIADVNINNFDISVIRKKIQAFDFVKINEKTEGETTIGLGGCVMPTEAVELVKEALKELNSKRRQRVKQDDLIVDIKPKNKDNSNEKEQRKSKLSADDLNSLFEDDDFWS